VIVVIGEALIDLVPDGEVLRPLPGGSPYNVAIGLARLGRPTAFVGRLSRDGFGRRLHDRLTAEGVEVDGGPRTDDPTTLAVIHLDERQQASYRFYLAGTSAAGLAADTLPELAADAALHLSFGAVTPTTEPAGSALAALVRREHPRRLVSLDPNVRPDATDDLAAARRRIEALLPDVDLVKVSDEDLAALAPDRAPLEVAGEWAHRGPALVVVTRGGHGAVGIVGDRRVEVAAPPVDVVDTVGAGDAFSAGLLAWLDESASLTPERLRDLTDGRLEAALRHATLVAARTCGRRGADPPRIDEL
jgi:fructokinase